MRRIGLLDGPKIELANVGGPARPLYEKERYSSEDMPDVEEYNPGSRSSKKIVPMELIEFIKNLADKDSIEADAVKMRLFPCT